jgi:hypothetical protein
VSDPGLADDPGCPERARLGLEEGEDGGAEPVTPGTGHDEHPLQFGEPLVDPPDGTAADVVAINRSHDEHAASRSHLLFGEVEVAVDGLG